MRTSVTKAVAVLAWTGAAFQPISADDREPMARVHVSSASKVAADAQCFSSKEVPVENQYSNIITHNRPDNQEDIDLYWNNVANGCLRAFFFNGDCADKMGKGNGTAVGSVYYLSSTLGRGLCVSCGEWVSGVWHGDSGGINCGNQPDIQNLTSFSISCWIFPRSAGGGEVGKPTGRICEKRANAGWPSEGLIFFVCSESNGNLKLVGRVGYSVRDAITYSNTANVTLNQWHHVAMVYDEGGDRRVHLYLDGEILPDATSVTSQGDRNDDSTQDLWIAARKDATYVFDGFIDDFLLFNRVLSDDEVGRVAGRGDFSVVVSPSLSRNPGLSILNPYLPKAHSYKGQLHCHSTNSDGRFTPAEVMTKYRDAGYDFVAIADHDYLTPSPGVDGILHIPAVEESPEAGHVLSLNPPRRCTAPSRWGGLQELVHRIRNIGALSGLAHVDASGGYLCYRKIDRFAGCCDFVDLWNGRTNVATGGESNRKWDYLLSAGKAIIWGLAVDDLHYGAFLDKGWVVVNSDELSVSAILESLKSGNFYASTGPTLSVSLSGKTVTAMTDSPSTITWIKHNGRALRSAYQTTADAYTIVGDEVYLRIEATRDSDGTKAWSQPLLIGTNLFRPDALPNEILNGDFEEEDLPPWKKAGTATGTAARDTLVYRSGAASCKVALTNTAGEFYATQDWTLDPSRKYTLRAWVYIPSTTVPSGYVRLHIFNSIIGEYVEADLAMTDRWQELCIANFWPGSDPTGTIKLTVATATDEDAVAYFDDVTLMESVPVFKGYSVALRETGGKARQFYQVKTLTDGDYIICFLAYTDGSAVTSADVVPFAGRALTNEVGAPNYEHIGGGAYLCWGKLGATDGEWNVGIEVKPFKLVYVALPTCYAVPISPRLSIVGTNNGIDPGIELSWYGMSGAEYDVLFADDMQGAPSGWQTAAEKLPGRGELSVWSDFGAGSRPSPFDPSVKERFYRIRLVPIVLPAER